MSKLRYTNDCRKVTKSKALIIDTSITFGREVLQGVGSYLHRAICFRWAWPPEWFFEEKWDGIIYRPTSNPKFTERLKELKIPTLNLDDTST